jgi:hypothetical protein
MRTAALLAAFAVAVRSWRPAMGRGSRGPSPQGTVQRIDSLCNPAGHEESAAAADGLAGTIGAWELVVPGVDCYEQYSFQGGESWKRCRA